MSVSPIPICLADVGQAGPNRNSQDDVRRSVGFGKGPFSAANPGGSHTHKHRAARPQAYKKIGGRKAASARALIAGWPRALEDAWQIVKKIPGYDKANTFIYICAWYN